MSSSIGWRVATSISCFCWNATRTRFAICPNDNTLRIYAIDNTTEPEYTFSQHDKLISGLDWCGHTDRIVTCSHDCNAYVLAQENGSWEPDMVITRLRQAALCVKWSPSGTSFAIGNTGKEVSVCGTDKKDGWWGAALIRGHGSAVMDIAWHPGGDLLATVCTDKKCRIFHASHAGPHEPSQANFGDQLMEISLTSWGLSVAWSPSGQQLVCCSHGAEVTVLSGLKSAVKEVSFVAEQKLQTQRSPFTCVAFISEEGFIAAGFDQATFHYHRCLTGPGWLLFKTYRAGSHFPAIANASMLGLAGKLTPFKSAIAKAHDSRYEDGNRHTHTIVGIQVMENSKSFSTAALDGRVLLWQVANEV